MEKVKKGVCFTACLLGVCLVIGWAVIYVILPVLEPYIPILQVSMIANVCYIIVCAVIGIAFFRFSVDQWFANAETEGLTVKQRVILWVAVMGIGVCALLFVAGVLDHHMRGVQPTPIEDERAKILFLTVFNILLSYAAYQAAKSS